jgi:nitronate monooxygenase
MMRAIDEALEAGADAIVAQGTEAGGHGAVRSTLPLVPEVADRLSKRSAKALLIAAGGLLAHGSRLDFTNRKAGHA